jgi:hypothetical protein
MLALDALEHAVWTRRRVGKHDLAVQLLSRYRA